MGLDTVGPDLLSPPSDWSWVTTSIKINNCVMNLTNICT